jgi:Xaa-Pro aminopeptidase
MTPRFLLLVALLVFFSAEGRSQTDLPDPLGSAFRISVQSKFRSKLPPKTCAVVFSGGFQSYDPARRFPRDFSCDPDFYYLTGYRLPDAVAVVFSEPRALAEGAVSTLLFLPDKTDYGLAAMGYVYRGKFGMLENGLAIRPTAQWKKFCSEVLAAENVERVFSKPLRDSDFLKPGDQGYNYLGTKLFGTLAPGFGFAPQAQRYYKEILAADTATMAALAQRISAMLEYEMPEQKDPILMRFLKSQNPEALRRLQEDIGRMKVDILQAAVWLQELRRSKTDKELALQSKAAGSLSEAIHAVAARVRTGNTEAKLQAIAEYILRFRGGFPAMPPKVAAGRNSALPNYTANLGTLSKQSLVVVDLATSMDGYHARTTRTLPVDGDFGTELRALYEGVAAIHQKSLKACIPGAAPSKLQQAAATGFDELDKRLIFSTNALGARKVLKITHLESIGLELEEGNTPAALAPDMVVSVETALYLLDEDGITAKWRGTGIVLRDMVHVTDLGNEVLTKAIPLDAAGVEAMVKATIKLPED